jgi:hypothetical protein
MPLALPTPIELFMSVEPVAVTARDGKTVVSTQLTGEFPGSPLTLDFVFTLEGGKIAALEIRS